MKNSKEKIKKIIEVLLGEHTELTSAKLEDGTIIEFSKLEVGAEIFIVTEEGNIPAPDGIHILEDGTQIETKDGIITNIIPKQEETSEEQIKQDDQVVAELQNKIAELESKIAKLEEAILKIAESTDKINEEIVEFKAAPANKKTNIKVEQTSDKKVKKSIYDFIYKK